MSPAGPATKYGIRSSQRHVFVLARDIYLAQSEMISGLARDMYLDPMRCPTTYRTWKSVSTLPPKVVSTDISVSNAYGPWQTPAP